MSPKPQHRRRASKGSRSFFSGDLWRSISRGRSRSALGITGSEVDLSRAPTFPCDPSRQTTVRVNTPAGESYTPSVETSASASLRNLYLKGIRRTPSAIPNQSTTYRRSRRLSWFSFARHKETDTGVQSSPVLFSQQNSMSSMSRSRIGTPVLTSTTNAQVADTENVEYSDVLLPDYSSRDAPSVYHSGHTANNGHHLQHSIVHPSTWSSTVRSMKKKFVHKRRASTSVLLETPWAKRVAEMKAHGSGANTSSGSVFQQVHAYKDKLHHRSGRHGSNPSQCKTEEGDVGHGDLSSLTFLLRNRSTPDFRLPPRLPGLYSESNTDLLAPSLAKSFASAIEKLDFNSSPTLNDGTPISKLRKAKSYLSLHRFVREYSDRTLDKDEVIICDSPQIVTSAQDFHQDSTSPGSSLHENKQDMYKPKIGTSKLIQLRFSGQKKKYVPSMPDANSPRGVNPLRMHPEVGNSVAYSGPVIPATAIFPDGDGERRSGSIDRAVIYSPSTGNLSVYSRTPSPKSHPGAPQERAPQDTPTRKPLHKASGSMLRKSMSTFFGKSASMIRVANFTPTKQEQVRKDTKGASRHRTLSDTKAYSSKSVTDIRERSMSTPEIHNSDGMRAAWDYQPNTPSPLRKSTMVDETYPRRQRAASSTTPMRAPTGGIMLARARSDTVFSDPEKRYGRYMDD